MKDIDKMLEGLAENKDHIERGDDQLTELEMKRIYNRTMQKIEEKRGKEMRGQKKGKIHFTKKYSRLATAAAVVAAVCLAGATAVAAFGMDQNIKNFFNIQDKATEKKAEKLVSEIDQKSVSNGVEIALSQVISDDSRCYAVLKAKNLPDTSEELKFDKTELTVSGEDGKTYDYTLDEPTMGGIDGNITTFAFMVSGVNDSGNDVKLTGKKIQVQLKNVGYDKTDGTFVPVAKGNWKLDWTVQNEAKTETVSVDKNIPLLDSKALWKDIAISPLSITVHYTITKQGSTHLSAKKWEKCEKSERLVVAFTDGTRLDSRFADDVNSDWGTKTELGYKSMGFSKIVDPDEIKSVTFGNRTILLNKNVKLETRKNITSKAVNCSIAFPEKLCKILSLEEKSNVKNRDLKCAENYTIFWGKKNGAKMPMFTIHRLKGEFYQKDLDEKAPMMVYIGYRGGYTYTIEYGELQDEAQDKEFADIMNKYISNILPYFEYLN